MGTREDQGSSRVSVDVCNEGGGFLQSLLVTVPYGISWYRELHVYCPRLLGTPRISTCYLQSTAML